jgi:hypothetical protein
VEALDGPVVLDPEIQTNPNLRINAQCMPGKKGGVTVLAMNASRDEEQAVFILVTGQQYTRTAAGLSSTEVELNGKVLTARPGGTLPVFNGEHVGAGVVHPGSGEHYLCHAACGG